MNLLLLLPLFAVILLCIGALIERSINERKQPPERKLVVTMSEQDWRILRTSSAFRSAREQGRLWYEANRSSVRQP